MLIDNINTEMPMAIFSIHHLNVFLTIQASGTDNRGLCFPQERTASWTHWGPPQSCQLQLVGCVKSCHQWWDHLLPTPPPSCLRGRILWRFSKPIFTGLADMWNMLQKNRKEMWWTQFQCNARLCLLTTVVRLPESEAGSVGLSAGWQGEVEEQSVSGSWEVKLIQHQPTDPSIHRILQQHWMGALWDT